jgi:hypothetical protein
MSGGITRTHGYVNNPKNFAGVSLLDATLSFWIQDGIALYADQTTANGALDQVFRTVVGTVGTVSRIGTLSTGSGATSNYIRFALEVLGADSDSPGYLGNGAVDNTGAVTTSTLETAIKALGTINGVHLSSATVKLFVY